MRARCLLAALGLGIDIEMLVRRGWEIGDIIYEKITLMHDILIRVQGCNIIHNYILIAHLMICID